MPRILLSIALLLALAISSVHAQRPTPAYLVLGDSIEFGLSDDVADDGIGYVPIVATFLASVLGQPPVVFNAGLPFAQTREIWRTQLPAVLKAAARHAPVIVSWGGGGNDLTGLATGPQAAACRQSASCLGRFNGLLNEVEQTIDRTIGDLRANLGPTAVILMRTQYNAFLRAGCGTPDVVALANVTLEGLDGSVLNRGLNDRIRSVAAKYDARVVDLFIPFGLFANTFVSADCIHPSGVGYQAIATLSGAAFLGAP